MGALIESEKRVRHFFYSGNFKEGDLISLSKEESAHALLSLRLGKGEMVVVSNGEGLLGKGEIWKADSAAQVKLVAVETFPKFPAVEIWQATLKAPKMDWLVEKLTELGVRVLQLVETEHTVAQTDKMERWEKIVTSALKQSENPWRLRLQSVVKLEGLLTAPPENALKCFLSPTATQPLIEVLGASASQPSSAMPERIILVIGPEGGLSPAEESRLNQAGFLPASLHPNILRGETAGIVAAALSTHWLHAKAKG